MNGQVEIKLFHAGESKNFFIFEPVDQSQAVGKLYIQCKLIAGPTPPKAIVVLLPAA